MGFFYRKKSVFVQCFGSSVGFLSIRVDQRFDQIRCSLFFSFLFLKLLLKPVEYRLVAPQRFSGLAESNLRVVATIFLYIVRQVTVIRGKAPMASNLS